MAVLIALVALCAAVAVLFVAQVPVLDEILPGGSSDVVVSPEEVFTDEMFYSLPEEGHVAVDNGTGLIYVDNEVLLYAEESAEQAEIEQLVAGMGGEVVGRIAETRSYQVRFEDSMEYGELELLISQIEGDGLISAAFPNYAMEIDVDASEGNPTDDPAWDNEDEMWGYEAINLEEAWNLVTADPSIVVGVRDNQFYSDHEDLSFASVVGYEFDSALASASHGTHVAGTIAADANGKGSVGVAYGCTLVGISFSLSYDCGTPAEGYEWAYGYEFDVTYLAAVEGARVVNCSTGCNDLTFCASHGNEQAQAVLALQAEQEVAFLEALVAGGHDFVICKSAGNSNVAEYIRIDEVITIGDDVYSWGFLPKDADTESYWSALSDEELKSRLVAGDTDANYDILGAIADPDVASRIIIVGASDRSAGGYAVASYSNGGSRVDVVAPGGESSGIYSSVAEKDSSGSLRSGYGYMCGTSMAAPMVSGVAALVYSANPDLTGDEVKDIICSTASGSYQSSGSFSDTYGLLDAEAAVKKALSYSDDDAAATDDGAEDAANVLPGGSDDDDDASEDASLPYTPSKTADTTRSVVLVADVSGSMAGSPIENLRSAATSFVDTVVGNDASMGIVAYDSDAEVVSALSTNTSSLTRAIANLEDGGSTNMEDGLVEGESMLASTSSGKKIIVLMSDGLPNAGKVGDELVAYAEQIRASGVKIYTVGFNESDSALMGSIADRGCHYQIEDDEDLEAFLVDIANEINGTRYIYVNIACPVDVTVTFDGETLSSAEEDLQTRTSFGSLTFEDETDEDGYATGEQAKILRLIEGHSYDISIAGTDEGSMTYTIGFADENGDYSDFRTFTDIAISSSTGISTVAQVADKTRLKVDEDGDGTVDAVYVAGANEEGQLVDNAWIARLIVAAFFVLVLIVAVTLIYRKLIRRGRLGASRQA